jgi:hypothetical protein
MKANLAKIIGNIALVAVLFFFSSKVQAQTGWHPIIGIKGGLNVDNLSSTPILGSNAGAYFAMEKGNVWGVGLEAFYAERHWQLGNDKARRVSYLEVPLYFNYFFLRKYTTIRPKIVIGPSFNILLEDERAFGVQNANAASFEMAGIIGLGFNKDLTKDGHITFFFDARYMQGFTSTQEKVEFSTANSYNRTLRFHAGVGFSLTGGRKKK